MATLNVAPALSAYDLRDGRLIEGKSFREVFVSLAVSSALAHINNLFGGQLGMRERRPARDAASLDHVHLVVGVCADAKMQHVAAQRVVARMKDMVRASDFSVLQRPREPVGFPRPGESSAVFAKTKRPVSCGGKGACPFYTTTLSRLKAAIERTARRAVSLFRHHFWDKCAAVNARLFHSLNISQGLPHGN